MERKRTVNCVDCGRPSDFIEESGDTEYYRCPECGRQFNFKVR